MTSPRAPAPRLDATEVPGGSDLLFAWLDLSEGEGQGTGRRLIALMLILGLSVPWWKGLDFLGPLVFLSYGLLAAVWSGPRVVRGVAVGRATVEGVLLACGVVGLGLAYLNVRYPEAGPLVPPAAAVAAVVMVYAGAAFLAAAAGQSVRARSATPARARRRLRKGLMVVLAGVVMWSFLAPNAWQDAVETYLATERMLLACVVLAALLAGCGVLILRPRRDGNA